jgi:hypothetical protein
MRIEAAPGPSYATESWATPADTRCTESWATPADTCCTEAWATPADTCRTEAGAAPTDTCCTESRAAPTNPRTTKAEAAVSGTYWHCTKATHGWTSEADGTTSEAAAYGSASETAATTKAAATLREGFVNERECQPRRRGGQKQKRSHNLLHFLHCQYRTRDAMDSASYITRI